MNAVIRNFHKGLPEIGMKSIDVVTLNDYKFWNHTVQGSIWLTYKLFNQKMYVFENTTITQVRGFGKEPTATKMEIHGRIPSLVHNCSFQAKGKVWFLQINTIGKSLSDFQNLQFILTLKVIPEYRNGSRYLKIYELSPVINLSRWIIRLDDYFQENSDLTLALNELFNSNWVTIWNDLEPKILTVFKRVVTNIIKDVFDKVPYDDMFLKDDYLS